MNIVLEVSSITRDLTEAAENGRLEAAFGRESEILTVLEVLSRRDMKNVILVGKEGVGKTRVAEGMAVAGVQGQTQGLLDDYRVISLDASTAFGAGLDRLSSVRTLLAFLRREPKIILMIDDMDELMGYMSGPEPERKEIATALLTPVLRGEIVCVGTMRPEKLEEFRSGWPALDKNFEHVQVHPMSPEKALAVLETLRAEIEQHHKLVIADDALRETIVASEEYFPEKYLPGKAVTLLDRVCSRYRYKTVAGRVTPESLEDTVVPEGDALIRSADVRRLAQRQSSQHTRILVLPDIWDELEHSLARQLPAQGHAVHAGIAALRGVAGSLNRLRKPKGVLIFAGPEGVGQKHMARQLAIALYDSGEALFSIDASEGDSRSWLKQLGEAMGGEHKDTLAPFGIVFIDHFESATTDTVKQLIETIRAGAYVDASGMTLQAGGVIFILNLVTEDDLGGSREAESTGVRLPEPLVQKFGTEVLRHTDAVVPFFPLQYDDWQAIVHSRIKQLRSDFRSQKLGVAVDPIAYRHIVDEANKYGPSVSRLLRATEVLVENPIRQLVSTQTFSPGTVFHVDVEGERLLIRKEKRPLSE